VYTQSSQYCLTFTVGNDNSLYCQVNTNSTSTTSTATTTSTSTISTSSTLQGYRKSSYIKNNYKKKNFILGTTDSILKHAHTQQLSSITSPNVTENDSILSRGYSRQMRKSTTKIAW
ncbi:unnamed protein product, partial [Didymodactylos carnosus]